MINQSWYLTGLLIQQCCNCYLIPLFGIWFYWKLKFFIGLLFTQYCLWGYMFLLILILPGTLWKSLKKRSPSSAALICVSIDFRPVLKICTCLADWILSWTVDIWLVNSCFLDSTCESLHLFSLLITADRMTIFSSQISSYFKITFPFFVGPCLKFCLTN